MRNCFLVFLCVSSFLQIRESENKRAHKLEIAGARATWQRDKAEKVAMPFGTKKSMPSAAPACGPRDEELSQNDCVHWPKMHKQLWVSEQCVDVFVFKHAEATRMLQHGGR
jgi:hypothetical protein